MPNDEKRVPADGSSPRYIHVCGGGGAACCILTAGTTPADASEPQISFTIPTSVPLCVKSDGTIIAPDSSSWRIENTGSTPITLSSVTASNLSGESVIGFSSQSVPSYESSSNGNWSYTAEPSGNHLDSLSDGNEHPLYIAAGSSVGIGWMAPHIDDGILRSVSSAPTRIVDIEFTMKPVYKQTFAVYSDDDKSLDFYKRVSTSLPAQGDTFNGKRATSVYTGFENGGYSYNLKDATNTPWFEHHEDIIKIEVIDSGIKIYNLKAFFSMCHKLTDADDVIKFDTSECTSMHDLFHDCTSLKIINLSGLNVSNTKKLSCIFHYDSALEQVDITGWNASSCETLFDMFDYCTNLQAINGIEDINVSHVYQFYGMFAHTGLKSLNLSKWNVSSGTDFHEMFANTHLNDITWMSKWNMSKATRLSGMFVGSDYANVDFLSNWDVSNVTNFEGMISKMPNLESFDISKWKIKSDVNMIGFSNEDPLLRRVSLPASLSTSKRSGILPVPSSVSIDGATGYWYAKSDGSAYTVDDIPMKKADTYYAVPAFAVYSETDKSLDFYNSHDVPKVGSTYKGNSVTNLYMGVEETGSVSPAWSNIVSKVEKAEVIDTIRPKSLYAWFKGAENMGTLSINKLVTNNVENAAYFLYHTGLVSIDLRERDFHKCKSLMAMMAASPNLVSVDVRDMNVSNVTNFRDVFTYDSKLVSLDCTGWDTSNGTGFWGFACQNTSLQKIDISSFVISKDAITSHMLGYGTESALRELKIGPACWLNRKNIGTSSKEDALPASTLPGSTGRWYSTADGKAYEYVADNCSYPYGHATTLKPQMKAATPDNLTISGKYVVNQTLTCNATASYGLKFQWQRTYDDDWKDIDGATSSTLKLTKDHSLYKIRCVVSPSSEEYSGEFYAYSADDSRGKDATVSDTYWYGTSISTPSSASVGETIHIEQTGSLPDEEQYGESTPDVTWMRDGGGIVVDKTGNVNTQMKSPYTSMTKWTGFIPHTYVYPGQRYTLTYGSLVETKGDEKCSVMLFEWTQMPASQVVTTLCDVPYSEAGGKISFEIPANLGRNSTYTIVIVAGTWGHNDEYFSATMTDYKVTCDDDGFIPITTKNGTYDYVPTADDSGHKLIAIVSWRNKYYTISERVSNPIDVK